MLKIQQKLFLLVNGFVSPEDVFYTPGEFDEIKEVIKENEDKILANFGGHIHGFYPLPIIGGDYFMNANKEDYPTLSTVPVITNEALLVGSNETDEYLKEHNKGLIRIVKVLSRNEIDYHTTEAKYNPQTGEGKEFIALNPYIKLDYKSFSGEPCMTFYGHTFTHKENSILWKVDDTEVGSGEKVDYCFPEAPKSYRITLQTIDKKLSEIVETISQKIEVKLGIIPKLLKITEEMKNRIELISTTIWEDLTEVGRTVKDMVLIKVKHSPSIPTGLIKVNFEKATQDIDLTQMITDVNLKTKKSVLYMPKWPKEVGESKILFIPK